MIEAREFERGSKFKMVLDETSGWADVGNLNPFIEKSAVGVLNPTTKELDLIYQMSFQYLQQVLTLNGFEERNRTFFLVIKDSSRELDELINALILTNRVSIQPVKD